MSISYGRSGSERESNMIDVLIPSFIINKKSAVENMMLLANESTAEFMAFAHDDLEIHDQDWQRHVEYFFRLQPECGMIGFGGAKGLGVDSLYKTRYHLQQLARIDYMSNATDAEVHGRRVIAPQQVAVLDGFCQIIRRSAYGEVGGWKAVLDMGITFHGYDLVMACLMAEKKWQVWMLPISCTHHGGMTSTSREYDKWLRDQGIEGDLEIHQKAHPIIYERFRNILPLRVKE
jgi:hypothetical protein